MAWHIFGIKFISRKEKEVFKELDLEMIEWHEHFHKKRWYSPINFQEEYKAFLFSMMMMMIKHKLSFEEALIMELDYRFWKKYNKRLSEVEDDLNQVAKS